MKKQYIIAISGFKNSGKTTVIQNLIPFLTKQNLKVATIKHDGHDFEPDVPDTDTFKHRKSGATGVAIFSDRQFMVTKEASVGVSDILTYFAEYDIVLLEGLKNSNYDKLEIVRSEVNTESYCKNNVLGYITNVDISTTLPMFNLDDYSSIANFIIDKYNS